MEAATYSEQDRLISKLIAPRWHTLVILILILAFSAIGALGAHSPTMTPPIRLQVRVAGYVSATVVEWLILAFVWFGIRVRGVSLRDLIGGRWSNWPAVVRDLGIVIPFFIASNLVSALLTGFLKVDPSQAVRGMLPHGGIEAALYLLMALTAGFCEEIIFRGYLQRQFTEMMENAGAAVVTQGILFAVFHGNQGWKFMVIIATYGWFLGALAYWRRSVRPGMIAHFAQDGLVGLLAPYLFK
jgi:membrane protease YdiL (CAAX protease family)